MFSGTQCSDEVVGQGGQGGRGLTMKKHLHLEQGVGVTNVLNLKNIDTLCEDEDFLLKAD